MKKLFYSLTETTPPPPAADGAGCHSWLSSNLLWRGQGLRQLGFSRAARPVFEQIHLLGQALCLTHELVRCVIFCVGFNHSRLADVETYPQGKKLIDPKPIAGFFTLPKALSIKAECLVAVSQIIVKPIRKIFQIVKIFSCYDHLLMVSV